MLPNMFTSLCVGLLVFDESAFIEASLTGANVMAKSDENVFFSSKEIHFSNIEK